MSQEGGSRESLEQALSAARDAGNAEDEARLLRELATVERAEGHTWRAKRLLEKALDIYRDTSNLSGVTAVMGELEPVADAEGDPKEPDPVIDAPRPVPPASGMEEPTSTADAAGSATGGAPSAPPGDASDLISMRPSGGARLSPPSSGRETARWSPGAPPGGSRREGTSWPVALGFLLLIAAVAGGLVFLGIRVVGEFLSGDGGDPSDRPSTAPHPATVEPSPSRTRLPASNERLTVRPTSCDVASNDTFAEVTMQVNIAAPREYQVVVLRGILTGRGGRQIGEGIHPIPGLEAGTRRETIRFTVFERIPQGRLTCGVEIVNAVHIP